MHAPIFWGAIPWDEILSRMQFRQGTFGMIELDGRYNAYAEGVLQSAHNIAAHLDGAPLVNRWEQSV